MATRNRRNNYKQNNNARKGNIADKPEVIVHPQHPKEVNPKTATATMENKTVEKITADRRKMEKALNDVDGLKGRLLEQIDRQKTLNDKIEARYMSAKRRDKVGYLLLAIILGGGSAFAVSLLVMFYHLLETLKTLKG